jgi:23S rRNA (uracil1939-C5)-methyltransferase
MARGSRTKSNARPKMRPRPKPQAVHKLGPKPDHVAERVTIARLGAQADGECDNDDETILERRYVPFTLPGEIVEISPDEGDYARLVSIITPSPERIAPVCRHFGQCGGCSLQHASIDFYRNWKREQLRLAFAQRGLEVTPEPLVVVPVASRRRVVFTARRGRSGIMLGYHAARQTTILPISECPILLPALAAALPALIALAEPLLSRTSEARLQMTATASGIVVDVTDGAKDLGPPQREKAAAAAQAGRFIRVTVDGDVLFAVADPVVDFSGIKVGVPAGAFLQATRQSEDAMVGLVTAATKGASRVVDLFAGLGTFTFALARTASVEAVESDPAAIASLTTASRNATGIKPVTVVRRDLLREPLGGTELSDLDAVVFDPPRAGAKAQSLSLAQSKVPIVIGVSCNPATLSRDARILVDGGYRLTRLVPIDQFVFTPHIEAVAIFSR